MYLRKNSSLYFFIINLIYNQENSRYFQLYNYFDGFKQAVDQVIISLLTGVTLNDPTMVKIQPFNCQQYYNDLVNARFSFLPPLVITLAFLFTVIVTVGNIVVEKQTKMKVIYLFIFLYQNKFS